MGLSKMHQLHGNNWLVRRSAELAVEWGSARAEMTRGGLGVHAGCTSAAYGIAEVVAEDEGYAEFDAEFVDERGVIVDDVVEVVEKR